MKAWVSTTMSTMCVSMTSRAGHAIHRRRPVVHGECLGTAITFSLKTFGSDRCTSLRVATRISG
jgi:hypothetical protein